MTLACESLFPGPRRSVDINIVELMPKSFNMFLGPLAGLFFIGMFVPRCTAWPAVVGTGIGVVFSIVWCYWKELFGTDSAPAFTLAVPAACLMTILTAFSLSLLHRDIPRSQYSWGAVVRGRTDQPQENDS